MKYNDKDVFCCPECRGPLMFSPDREPDSVSGEVTEGSFTCANCNREYPNIKSIPRFVNSDNYASSFGYQWKKFARTQIDGSQKKMSKIRFYTTTKWPDNLRGQIVLEAGCGAGRFSEIMLDSGAKLYSFDLSEAVEIGLDNIKSPELKKRYHPFQADMYKIPLPYHMFDKVLCMGVLQHCPDVKKAYLNLTRFLKPGGELVVDCYLAQPLEGILNPKYLLRPLFRWWKPSCLFMFCSVAISILYGIKLLLARISLVGERLSNLIPIGRLNYEPDYHFSVPEIKEIKTLSMFDMLSPKYDRPQKLSSLRSWMKDAGLEILELTTGYNGINARARRPLR